MQKRDISQVRQNKCKKINTFILAPINMVKSICKHAGQPDGKMTKSLKPFPIVICKLKNKPSSFPDCEYRGKALTRRIIIKCVQGLPVHYDNDIDYCENWTADVYVTSLLNKMHLTAYVCVFYNSSVQ